MRPSLSQVRDAELRSAWSQMAKWASLSESQQERALADEREVGGGFA